MWSLTIQFGGSCMCNTAKSLHDFWSQDGTVARYICLHNVQDVLFTNFLPELGFYTKTLCLRTYKNDSLTRFLYGDTDLEPSESISGFDIWNLFVCSSISHVLVPFQKMHVTTFPLRYLSTLQTLYACHKLDFQADIQGMRSCFLCLVRKSNSVIPSWLRTIWGPSGFLDTAHSTEQNPGPANLSLFSGNTHL